VKIITINLLFILSISLMGFAQNEKKMNMEPLRISMQKGENKVINYKTLEVDPVNLFIQERPWNDRSVDIQLELNIKENDKTFHTYLWYNEPGKDPLTNYPKAWGRYIYSLEIDKNDAVNFVVDELKFGVPFFIELGKEAKIGNLTINFKESMDVMGARRDGDSRYDSYAEYKLKVFENKDEKEFSFTSLNINDEKEQVLTWKNYEIKVLVTEIRSLKLVVQKKENK
jgi:hypothetical protein